jgi:hypothetical protein
MRLLVKSLQMLFITGFLGFSAKPNIGLAEKVFNQLFFVYGKKELGMLVLGLRPNPQLIC